MNLFHRKLFSYLILSFLFGSVSSGQSTITPYKQVGNYFIKYYSSEEYKASSQNWCVQQSKNGIMYFGNTEGILEYDGTSWRLIKIPNNSVVRSLSIDENDKIYVAASSDFGFLRPDSIGRLQFVSLLNLLDKKYREFGDVWDVVTASSGVYFKTRDKIFRYSNNKIKVFENVNSFRLYKINDEVFVRNNGIGLQEISGDTLVLVPDGEKFSSIGVYDLLPFGNRILLTTTDRGLFLYDGTSFTSFQTEADIFLIWNRLYNSCMLNDGNYAFATMRGGAAIIDKNGKLIRIINSKSGLSSNIIYDIYSDKQAGLWLAMSDGISRVESLSPFTVVSKKSTANTSLLSIFRFKDKLYASSAVGLFYYDGFTSSFNLVTGTNTAGLNFLSIDNKLYFTTDDGIYTINNDNSIKQLLNFEVPVLYQSAIDKNIIYVLYRIGVAVLKYSNGELRIVKNITSINNEISSLAEDGEGNLWVQTYYEGVLRIKNLYNKLTDNSKIEIEQYALKKEVPGNSYNIFSVNNKTLFATNAGLFRFDSKSKKFIADYTLGEQFTDSTNQVLAITENADGSIWILAKIIDDYEIGKAIKQNDGKFRWKADPEFRRLNLKEVIGLYSDFDPVINKEILWITTNKGLIRYEGNGKKYYNSKYSTFIRKVIVDQDSLIYNGYKSQNNISGTGFSSPTIVFQFSASSYDKPEGNLFQYYLEGNDYEWSKWTTETVKEFTNLSGGEYTFHVRSKNVYGIVGQKDTFTFTILPAWYYSWWAYILYIAIILSILYLIRRYELNRLYFINQLKLEKVQTDTLRNLDHLKSNFFANLSHEFRTPLTLILGQIESVMSSNIETKEKGKLQVANRNARRLLNLINQLLDLSKLEAGSMELNAEQHNIVSFLKSLFYSFESLAESKKISLKFDSELENIPVIFDPDKMEKVFYNLVSNAFKFTSANGEIKVLISVIEYKLVEIKVIDTGMGIPENRLPHIFNRFYQVDSTSTREHEGTGIGLALTKELVELHKGKIIVTSKSGEGTEFIISLPLGDLKIEKEKLVELPSYKTQFENNLDNVVDSNTNTITNDGETLIQINNNEVSAESEIILIVEDNSDVRAYIREQFEDEYKVIEACNGEVGISLAQLEIPDLIITDVMMPEMDGYKFSKEIRKNIKTSHIPIIMLTAKAGLDDKIEGLETGIDAYLTKPFSAKEIRVRVKNLIYQRKQLRTKFRKSTILKPSEVSEVSVDQIFLERTLKVIEANLQDDQFAVENLASQMNMSLSQLNRKMKALIDQPPGHLIRSLRLQKAADMLKLNAGTVAEICYKVGFNDHAYFSRAFKRQFDMSPSDYKKDSNNHSANNKESKI